MLLGAEYGALSFNESQETHMHTTQHTPGPWAYRKCPCGDRVCARYRITHAGSEGMFGIEDARLIAAAPELLAALREISAMLDRPGSSRDYMIRDKADAAIAKAVTP